MKQKIKAYIIRVDEEGRQYKLDKIHYCRLNGITFIIEGKLFSLVVAIGRKATPKATHA